MTIIITNSLLLKNKIYLAQKVLYYYFMQVLELENAEDLVALTQLGY